MPLRTYQKYEAGKIFPPTSTLSTISKVCRATPSELFLSDTAEVPEKLASHMTASEFAAAVAKHSQPDAATKARLELMEKLEFKFGLETLKELAAATPDDVELHRNLLRTKLSYSETQEILAGLLREGPSSKSPKTSSGRRKASENR